MAASRINITNTSTAIVLFVLLCAAAYAQTSAPDLLGGARTLSADGRLDDATRAYRQIIEQYPDTPPAQDAMFELSRVYERQGRLLDAASLLLQLYESDPGGALAVQALDARARSLINAGLRDDALETYQLLMRGFPDSRQAVDAAFQASALLRAAGRLDEAAQTVRPIAASADPNDALNAHRALAEVYLQAKRWYEAETEINIILKSEPQNYYFHERLAQTHAVRGNIEQAAAIYEQLTTVFPNNPHYEDLLFALLRDNKLLTKKIEELQRWKQKEPGNLDPVRRLVRLYLWMKQGVDALRELEIIVEAEPGNLNDAVTLARLYYENQWRKKARETLDRALGFDPNYTPAWQQLGDIQYADGEGAEARVSWERAAMFSPGDAASYARLGTLLTDRRLFEQATLLYEQGRDRFGAPAMFAVELINLYRIQMRSRDALDEYLALVASGQPAGVSGADMLSLAAGPDVAGEAVAIIEPWLARAPDSRPLRVFYTEVCDALGQRDAAIAELGRYASTHADEFDIFLDTAPVMQERGRYGAAAVLFEKAASRPLPRDTIAIALMGAARAYRWSGDPGAAARVLERLIAEIPDAPDMPEALFLLGSIRAADGAHADALELFRKLAAAYPESMRAAPARLAAAEALIRLGEFSQAGGELDQLYQEPAAISDLDRIEFLRGETWFLRGMFPEAEKHYRALLAKFPDSRYVNDALERLLFVNAAGGADTIQAQAFMAAVVERNLGKLDEAADLFEGMTLTLAGTPLGPYALFELANTRAAQARLDDAERLYLQLADTVSAGELFALSLLRAAEVQIKLGHTEDALRTCQRLLDTDPGSFWAHTARDLLRDLAPGPQS